LDVIKVPKEALKNCTSFASIDRGCSLTKVIIVPKSTVSEEDIFYHLHCSSFLNIYFDKVLEYIRDEAYLTEGQDIRVTGAGCDMHQDQIEKTLGRKICFVDEFFCQMRGAAFLLKNLGGDELFHPWVHLSDAHLSYKIIPDLSKSEVIKDITGEADSEAKHFPNMFVFLGSAAGIVPMFEDLRVVMPTFTGVGGRCFLGLSRMLLGTGDYTEITELASRGNNKCDTCLLDVFSNNSGTTSDNEENGNPYLYPFGKLSDDEEPDFSQEDVALSVVRAVSINIVHSLVYACRNSGLKRVIFGGNMGRAEIFRISLLQAISSFQILDAMEVRFLKTGHTGAIGAMITNIDDLKGRFFGMDKKQ